MTSSMNHFLVLLVRRNITQVCYVVRIISSLVLWRTCGRVLGLNDKFFDLIFVRRRLGIKFTYGLYLRDDSANDEPAVTVSRRRPELSWPEDPFKWHIQPQKSKSISSSTSLLNREVNATPIPSSSWPLSLDRSCPSNSSANVPAVNTVTAVDTATW